MLCWRIGERIQRDILGQERAEYGKRIVQTLSAQLTMEYGRGFDRTNLFHMIRFVEAFPAQEIVYALSRQLSWTHFRAIIYLTELPPRELLASKLHEAIRVAREQVALRKKDADS